MTDRPLSTNECWEIANTMFLEGKIHRYRVYDDRGRKIADVNTLTQVDSRMRK